MQPMLVICASQPGILYLNGCFAGEVSADDPLMRPAAPRGALYLDYRPLADGWAALARKIVFSGGKPMAESIESAEGIGAIIWPGGICEIEISPPASQAPAAQRFSFGGHSFSIQGDIPKLYCGDTLLGSLPERAALPAVRKLPGGYVFTGETPGGMYLLTSDAALRGGTGFLSAEKIEIDAEGNIHAFVSENDFAGHAALETWRLAPEGLELVSSEEGWSGGSRRHPESAQDTVIAAVQAALAGRMDEAEECLSEALRGSRVFDDISGKYDLCIEMKYGHPDNRPCIALLRLENDHLAVAEPLYYRCGQKDGKFRVDQLELGDK